LGKKDDEIEKAQTKLEKREVAKISAKKTVCRQRQNVKTKLSSFGQKVKKREADVLASTK
jgi:hypothetical protein